MARTDNHCPHCGEKNGAKGDFCPRCGKAYATPVETSFKEEENIVNEEKPIEEKEKVIKTKKSKNGWEIAMMIVNGTLIIILLIMLFGIRDNKENTIIDETKVVETTVKETAVEETTVEETIIDAKNFIEVDGETIETFVSNPISENGIYLMHDSDMNEIMKDLSKAIGFVPDENLLVSDLEPKELGQETASITGDWDTYLNTERDGFGPLAGFTDGTNDYNQYFLHQSKPQLSDYSWTIHSGLYVEIPGIGRVIGGPGRAVMVLIINRTDDVYRFKTEPVTVIAGFQGWGRIWNGEPKEVIETEKRLSNHFLTRFGLGIPEKGFIGQTDQSYENATTVTVVTVERIQWGNNPDGTPRYQLRLIRAETVDAIK